MHNLNYAFDVAEKHLDIPRMLDAEGMIFTSDSCVDIHVFCLVPSSFSVHVLMKCYMEFSINFL